jgi:glycosyltransferase involved in cell wall biosynthesis
MLKAFVTDANAALEPGGVLARTTGLIAPRALARLQARRIPADIPADSIHAYLAPTLQIAAADRLGPRIAKSARTLHRLGIGGNVLARRTIAADFFGADTIYVHPCVTTDAVFEARRRGLRIVLEAISHPFNKRVELAECARYGVRPDQSEAQVEDNIAFFREEAMVADVVLAASPYVSDGLVELGLPAERVAIVRYGLDQNFFADLEVSPVPGRVLYVGAVNYLKGVPTLATASRLLSADGIDVEVAGPVSAEAAGRAEFSGPRYLGQVPRSQIRRHFAMADVFAFPSLSDGFGLVLLEAMAAGLPVVSTRNCADLVRDGENGFLVPDRDPEALAEAIRTIVRDRDLRGRFSCAARETAARHTLHTYAGALARAVAGGGEQQAAWAQVAPSCPPPTTPAAPHLGVVEP